MGLPRLLAIVTILACCCALGVITPPSAHAQGPAPAASVSSPSSAAPPGLDARAPEKPDDRPVRGPALRDRGARRPRAGGAATGVLFLVILVGAMGYYVLKRLRRYR
ncbi:MAG: hypothetical protein JWP97_6610 [Labilithrix sp.]|nr:hypothetical protein [Labilithrix sp.]